MKTICFFNTTQSWGGGEKWHLETCSHMFNNGYKVLFITNEKSELYKKLQKTKINHIGLNITNLSFTNLFTINKVKRILKKNNVETIIINLSRDLKIAGLSSKIAGVNRIIYRRGSAIPIKNSFINRYYFKNIITDILANSAATKKTVLQNNPKLFPEKKIQVIYNGIDVDAFIAKEYNPTYIKNKNELVLVNLGRLEFQKNQKFLIELAKELKKRAVKFKLIIGGEGRLKNELIELTKNYNLEKEILFPGFIEKPKDLILSGDIFLLSSLWEGFGYVLAEAALCKKPIIAFNTSSNPEVVKNNISGFLTPLNDINIFADKVEYLKNNPTKMNEMGFNGYQNTLDTFDSKKNQKLIEEYLVGKEKSNKITALLITYNEINNIDTILENISFANEIIVVDSYSTDGTIERIKEHKKVKLIQREFKNYTDQKAFALKQATYNWILFLDADERLDINLQKEILSITNSNTTTADAYYFYRTFMFKDEVLKFSGSQSDKNYRLFKKDKVNFVDNRTVHETLIVNGETGSLKNKLIHYCYSSYNDYKGKMIKYGKMKAFDELKKDYTPNSFHFIIKPAYKFFYNYILRLGILDGKKGIIISYLSALGVHARYKELKRLRNATK